MVRLAAPISVSVRRRSGGGASLLAAQRSPGGANPRAPVERHELTRLVREDEARSLVAKAVAIRLKRCRTHGEYMKEVAALLNEDALPIASLTIKCDVLSRHAAALETQLARTRATAARNTSLLEERTASVEEQARARTEVELTHSRETERANAQLVDQLRAAGHEGERRLRETAARQVEVSNLRLELAQLGSHRAGLEREAGEAGEREAELFSGLSAARAEIARLQQNRQ
ncbi:hypothetical protein T492DRAFT_847251 [Pavlovales sp. CCMP2436]|nr:hypothetical protein T492DRAFT_847251 [Pavlovales sp. CCMP2436]